MCKRIFALLLAVTLICFSAAAVHADDSSVTLYGFSFTINVDGNAVIHSYDNRSSNVVIPKSLLGAEVTEIDDYAFFGNTDIKSVSFENCDGLKKIGTNAFYGCTGIKDITIPSSVNELGFGAFQNCSSLENVTIENGITSLPKQLFYNCESLKSVVIPESVESIGNVAFANCPSLREIEIPDSVTSIDKNAFKNSDKLIIFCNEGSPAADIARENGMDYRVIKDFELGDVNLDGKINIRDATIIQLSKVGRAVIPVYQGKNYADVNHDGKITVRDVTLIQMKVAKIFNSF